MAHSNRQWKRATWRGFSELCPACGKGALFTSYAKATQNCSHCGLAVHHHRADDAPPYFTIMVVGHIIIPMMLLVEKVFVPPLWLHAALWLPMTLVGTLWLLPRIKGATIGLQWAMGMHGFSDQTEEPEYPQST